MKWYKSLCTFEVIADNIYFGARSQSIIIRKDQVFSIWAKQKDMFDSNHEYWTTYDGWLLKIERQHLAYLEEVNSL